MLGRQRGGWGRARPGLTFLELIVALVLLGLMGSLVLSCHMARQATEFPPATVNEGAAFVDAPEPVETGDELSLQATLDRLGYTVNVPAVYDGCFLEPRGHQHSTLDDTVEASWFRSTEAVSMQLVSQQTDLDAGTRFVVETAATAEVASFTPVIPCGFNETPRLLEWDSTAPVSFRLDVATADGEENRQDGGCLLVLPARKNGYWVSQEGKSGYWAGGEDTGEYLLCWEDMTRSQDLDFQDLVFVARGIVPSVGPVAP